MPHQSKKKIFKKWVWDFIPLHAVEFTWVKEGGNGEHNEAGAIHLFVEHVLDTSYEDLPDSVEPDPQKINSDSSTTVLRVKWVVIGENATPFSDELWEKNWEELLAEFLNKKVEEFWWKEKYTLSPQKITKNNVVVGMMAVVIDDLETPADFDEKFITPILEICSVKKLRNK